MKEESAKEEILVNVTPREVRAALLENGVLQEIFIERAARRGLIGNLYKGHVSRVLPGMQAAFVDIGLDRTAFLHASDIEKGNGTPSPLPPEEAELPELADGGMQPVAGGADAASSAPDIRGLVREGEEVLVQVVKDPIGNKGARLTTFITLPSRFLVFLPNGSGVGISARIEDEPERERLRSLVEAVLAEDGRPGGVIVRTAAEGSGREALAADLQFLRKLWTVVQEQCRKAGVKALVHEDLPLPLRILRDLVTNEVERIQVDSEAGFHRMQSFATTFLPDVDSKIELYARQRPIFDLHGIEDEIARALDRSIPLKSGGHVVFDQTEAMTTVDVNT
ncbi:MAG TPA: ribonuclease E/G, partial [Woeseiaceae bacterium]|nr:ribonuclease E/G [Woeseiaceae bacterium]